MSEFVQRSLMPASAADVLAWHARPGAFERLLPPWEQFELVQSAAELANGARAEFLAPIGPLRRRWVAEHHALEGGIGFRDVQITGPFARWQHTHKMTPADATTSWLEDRVEFELPLGWLGRALLGNLIRGALERTFAYRHRVTSADLATHQPSARKAHMNVLVSGSTGLVGSALVPFLTTGGHRVSRLVRHDQCGADEVTWNPAAGTIDVEQLSGLDGVVHLAGDNIAHGRWTPAKKARIRDSRVNGTRLLCNTLAQLKARPKTLVCASAIGFYGDRGDELLTERSPAGPSFLCDVCREWEDATESARQAGIRVVNLRIGVVLSPRGGALAKMLLPFQMCLGGIVGSGQQFWSWIALDDVIGAILHSLTCESLTGPVNAVSPEPVTNRDFTKTLGRVLKRPTVFPMPAFAARLALGEMADELLLSSTRVQPYRLAESGYQFRCPTLDSALRHVLGR